jgi:hypothetical protein
LQVLAPDRSPGLNTVSQLDPANTHSVGQQVKEAELGTQKAGEDARPPMSACQRAGRNHRELEELDEHHEDNRHCCGSGAPQEQTDNPIDHGPVQGVPKVLIEDQESGMKDPREYPGRDDAGQTECPGCATRRGYHASRLVMLTRK